jgi:hypothetical protein
LRETQGIGSGYLREKETDWFFEANDSQGTGNNSALRERENQKKGSDPFYRV